MAWQGEVLEGVLEEFAARARGELSHEEFRKLGFTLLPEDRTTAEYRKRHAAEVARYSASARGKASVAAYRARPEVKARRLATQRARYHAQKQASA